MHHRSKQGTNISCSTDRSRANIRLSLRQQTTQGKALEKGSKAPEFCRLRKLVGAHYSSHTSGINCGTTGVFLAEKKEPHFRSLARRQSLVLKSYGMGKLPWV